MLQDLELDGTGDHVYVLTPSSVRLFSLSSLLPRSRH